MAKRIQEGDRAPDFTAIDQHGSEVRLYALLEKGPVVLYFYPKDDTPGCTTQACSFRDDHDDFVEAGASVVGVSADAVDRHKAFAHRHNLPFTLLSDEDGKLRALFDVPKTFGFLPGRVTYVIDRDGTVKHVYSSQLKAASHVGEALETVRKLSGSGAPSAT